MIGAQMKKLLANQSKEVETLLSNHGVFSDSRSQSERGGRILTECGWEQKVFRCSASHDGPADPQLENLTHTRSLTLSHLNTHTNSLTP